MSRKSQTGTAEQAIELQKANNVPAKLQGAWYHRTSERLKRFNSSLDAYLTRSPTGGKPKGNYVAIVYVIYAPSMPSLRDAQAGDVDGMDPENPGRYLKDWWLKVRKKEVSCLMVVDLQEVG